MTPKKDGCVLDAVMHLLGHNKGTTRHNSEFLQSSLGFPSMVFRRTISPKEAGPVSSAQPSDWSGADKQTESTLIRSGKAANLPVWLRQREKTQQSGALSYSSLFLSKER